VVSGKEGGRCRTRRLNRSTNDQEGSMTKLVRRIGVWLVLLVAAGIPLTAAAQSADRGAADGGAAQGAQDPQALLADMEQLQQRLLQIQEQAVAENPELRKQAEQLQQTMLEAMREEGHDPEQSIQRLQELEQRLRSPETGAAEHEKLIAEMRAEQQKLMAAEQAVSQREEVQKAREQFMENLLSAMREQEPRTDELMASLKQKSEQLQEIVSAQADQVQ
jgi:hypothetical protein